MAAIRSNGPQGVVVGGGGEGGDRGLLCFAGGMTVRVVQTEPVGLLLLSERLIQTRKDVFLQRKNSLLADDLFSRKIVMIQYSD